VFRNSARAALTEVQSSVQEPALERKLFWQRLWRIAKLAWSYRYRLGLSVFLSGLSVSVALVLPLGMRDLLNAAVLGGSRAWLDKLALLLLCLYAVRAALNFCGPLLLQLTSELIVLDLRNRLYLHIHSLGLGYFANQRTGDLLSRLTSDVDAMRSAITDLSVSLLLQSLKLLGSLAIMVVLNWRLALLIIFATPLATLVSRRYAPEVQRLSREVQNQHARATAIAHEALAGIRLVKAFDRASYEAKRFARALRELFATFRHVAITTTVLQVVVELIVVTGIVAIFWYGGSEVLARRLTAGDFVAFMFYAQNVSQGIAEVIRLYTSAHATVGASGRVFDLLDIPPDIGDSASAVHLPQARGGLLFERVSFAYDSGKNIFTDISLEIRPGEHVAIVGLSGTGKTTLLNLILRFFDPTTGTIRLDGHDLRAITISSLRRNVSIVSQEVYLFSGSIRDNIRYSKLSASDDEIESAAAAAQIHDFITELPQSYDTQVGENGWKLSGGQRQRIAIARALLKNAPLLLLDEATSSVDAAAEQSIREATMQLQRGRTVIVITHRLESIRHLPRIIVLDGGTIMADGPHDSLVSLGGLYSDLVCRATRMTEPSTQGKGRRADEIAIAR
jgi:subfamily B ATP-binding cassette protein MsbA